MKQVWRNRLFFWVAGGLLPATLLACSSIGLVDPAAENAAIQSTVAAMNATLEALKIQQTQPPPPSPQIIVVTATPTDTPPASPTPISTPTPLPTATPVPATSTPAPVAAQAGAPGRTIVIIVTPTSPPTPTPYPEAPIIISPREGAIVAKNQETLLHWSWNGVLLQPDEYYEVKLRPDGQSRSVYIAQERGLSHELKPNLAGGRYYWTVQIAQGYWLNNSGHPDDWRFIRFRSPESEPRLIIIDDSRHRNDDNDDDDDDGGPASISQAEPPHPQIAYGLTIGGAMFAGFAAFSRLTHKKRKVK